MTLNKEFHKPTSASVLYPDEGFSSPFLMVSIILSGAGYSPCVFFMTPSSAFLHA